MHTLRIPTDAPTAPEVALLRLLLGDPRQDPDNLDWSAILPIAERHGVLLRLEEWFAQRGEGVPRSIAASMTRARERHGALLVLIKRLGERCARHEIEHVFLKAAQQFPDVGRDVDLLVSGRATDVDDVLLDWASERPVAGTFKTRMAGTTSYEIPSCDATLVVHHGRVGRLGEHGRLAWQLLRRRRRVQLAEASWFAPSPEDALILQALHRLYGRPALRVRDAHWIITTVKNPALDWDYLLRAARQAGLRSGLSCFLDYADQICRQVMDVPLLSLGVREQLAGGRWGKVEFRGGVYRFPSARITGGLYLREFCADVASGNWDAAGRLCLLPVLAATAGYQRLAHPMDGGR